MDARRARDYYYAAIEAWKDDKDMAGYVEALQIALDAVAPPLGAGHCEWVFLPDKDLTPYSHMAEVTKMQDWMDHLEDEFEDNPNKIGLLRVSEDEVLVLDMALTVYKSVLMQVNKDEIRESLTKKYAANDEEQETKKE